jgi:TM2 domain-containing membrane protein YozV
VAVVLSFFWAGLGQLYNGQIAKGIIFIIVYALCALSCYIVIGFVTTPIVWIIGMVDAYSSAGKINQRMYHQQGQYPPRPY